MQVKAEQLTAACKKKLAPVYLISGDVPLLVREAKDALRAASRQHGFDDREILHLDSGFNWQRFHSLTANFNLFSSKIVIELNNPHNKLDEQAKKNLLSYLENPNPDVTLVIIMGKLTGPQKKTKWYKAIDAVGVVTHIWPVGATELPRWIQARLTSAKLTADQPAVQLLADWTEGNLLASAQTIEKLKLLYPGAHITLEKMQAAVAQNTRFSVFDLVNYMLANDNRSVVRVLDGLKAEGEEPTFVLWAITRELRILWGYAQQIHQGQAIAQVTAREWQSRKRLVQTALQRLPLSRLRQLIQQAEQVDHMIKGIRGGDVWNALCSLGLRLSSGQR